MNKFSVLMCVWGGDNPDWFSEAVESILNQTVKPDEVVITADGPLTPELDNILLRLGKNSLFKIIRLDKNFNCVWTFSGIDIFTTLDNTSAFVIDDDRIKLRDFQNNYYEINFDGKLIKKNC